MSLTISVTLDDLIIQEFLEDYNSCADEPITEDMLLQNEPFKNAVVIDMINEWLSAVDRESSFELYNEFFNENFTK